MANIKISELNELTKSQTAYDDFIPVVDSSANETKKISVENLTANNVYLLAVVKPNGQVPAPVAGAKYYNESTNKIYYALDDEHWYEYGTPVEGIFYVVLGEKGNYIYDAENEILVSVGGGSGSQVVVEPDEPTEDTKLIIEESDLDFQGLEISNTYTTGDKVAYSADYVNNINTYSTDEVRIGTWIDGKPIYRKVIPNLSITLIANQWVDVYDSTSLNIDALTNLKACRLSYYDWINSPYYRNLNNNIALRFTAADTITALIIEYTKTTD